MSRWIVFGVTSISAASVVQFGKRPARMILWISITRHIATRLVPLRMTEEGRGSWVRGLREADALDMFAT
jgi:hypothetical protein